MKKIGETFGDELKANGLAGLPFSWGEDGSITFSEEIDRLTRQKILDVYNKHDPTATLKEIPIEEKLRALKINPKELIEYIKSNLQGV